MKNNIILIVTSEAALIASIKMYINNKYEIATAKSYFEGIGKANRLSPILIIIGYLEPRGNSFLFHQKLREDLITKEIPLLIIDVRPEEHLRKGWRKIEGMQMQAEGYMSQPASKYELRKEINWCLEKTVIRQMELKKCVKAMEN